MRFSNASGQDVLIFVYDPGDAAYPDALADPAHLTVWANANAKALVPAVQSATLTHRADPAWLLGIKAAGLGRLAPFIMPLSGQTYTAADALELDAQGAPIWLTAPLPRGSGRLVGVGKADITDMAVCDPKSGLPMQGWVKGVQLSTALDGLPAANCCAATIFPPTGQCER